MPNPTDAIQQTLDAIASAEQIENEALREFSLLNLRRRLEYLRNEQRAEATNGE